MGWQCVPQSIGLVRGEPKDGQKNRANGEKICAELGEERESASTTIDRSRSGENAFYGYRSGRECWAHLQEDADAYRSEYTDKNGVTRSRKLPKQAIVGVAVIINPPNEIADGWSVETHDQFQQDATDVLGKIEPRLFGASGDSDRMRMRADHFDEGRHSHYVYECIGQGSVYDAKLRQRMAMEFAQKMREKGWDIDDPELTDWEKYGELAAAKEGEEQAFQLDKKSGKFKAGDWVRYANPEYRAEIDGKRERRGRSQPEFAAAKKAEERAAKAEEKARQANNRRNEAERQESKALGKARKAEKDATDAESRRATAEAAAVETEGRVTAAESTIANFDEALTEALEVHETLLKDQKAIVELRKERKSLDVQIAEKKADLRQLTERGRSLQAAMDEAEEDDSAQGEFGGFRKFVQSEEFRQEHPAMARVLAPAVEFLEEAMKLYRQRQAMRYQTLRERLLEAEQAAKPKRDAMLARQGSTDGAPAAHSSGIELGG